MNRISQAAATELKDGRFLIAGGFGLIGSHIAEQLLAADAAQVILFDNVAVGSAAAVEHLRGNGRVKLLRGDILRLNEVYDALDGVSGVFHTAYFITLPLAQNLFAGMDVNIRGLMNMLEACRCRGVKKIVYSSSIAAYGSNREGVIKEDDPFNHNGVPPASALYGAGKVMAEHLCAFYKERYALHYVAVRISTVYGERQHARGLNVLPIVQAYDDIRNGRAPMLAVDPSEVHDYIYAGDVARAQLTAMSADVTGEVFTVASGEPVSFEELIRTVLSVCGSPLEPIFRDHEGRLKSAAATKSSFSIAKANEILGWAPRVTLKDGIARLVAWYERGARGPGAP
jgi:UDP-glucose 4-epimerase